MQTYNFRGPLTAAFIAAVVFVGMSSTVKAEPSKDTDHKSSIELYREGLAAYRSGNGEAAVRAFEQASNDGVLGAQLHLARMYFRGQLVEKNEAKSFEQYLRIVRGFDYLRPEHPGSKYVAEAYFAIGEAYEKGVPALHIAPTPKKAANLYGHAASYFAYPKAQFNLGRMYLKGVGVKKNVNVAAKWFYSAAKKNHAPSQALLADVLWAARKEPGRAVQALALVNLALANAQGPEREWIGEIHNKIFQNAKQADKTEARLVIAQWKSRFGEPTKTKVAANVRVDGKETKVSELNFHPDPVSVIMGEPGGAEAFDPSAIFGAATRIDIPGF